MSGLKDKNVLVIDEGFSVELSVRLAPFFKNVYYCVTYEEALPGISKAFIGVGLEGVKVIGCEIFAEYDDETDYEYDKIDLFIMTFCYTGVLQEKLIKDGKLVYGCRLAEQLELDRVFFLKTLKKLKLNVPEYVVLKGLDKLDEFLQTAKGVWYIKISKYRGIKETFKFEGYNTSKSIIWDLRKKLGLVGELITFIAVKKIDSYIEPGADTIFVKDQYLKNTLFGFESKDELYFIKAIKWDQMPDCVKEIHEAFIPILTAYGCCGNISSEVLTEKNSTNYFTDITCRMPSPPGEMMWDMMSNPDEVIYYAAMGEAREPIFEHKYGVLAYMYSYEATTNNYIIEFPESIRPFVKLWNACRIKGQFMILKQQYESDQLGCVLGFGDTLDEAIEDCKAHAKLIKGIDIDIKIDSIPQALEIIKKAKEIGINF
jgi:hypothetical protein